jgi:hypothetical protein
MGWICGWNRFAGVFVKEVVEPVGEPHKGEVRMWATEAEPCASGGKSSYLVRKVYATKAEAENEAVAAEVEYREWRKRADDSKAARAAARKAKGYAKRVHLPTQSHAWRYRKDFVAARKKGLALCELQKTGSKALTTEESKVTCHNCMALMRANGLFSAASSVINSSRERKNPHERNQEM